MNQYSEVEHVTCTMKGGVGPNSYSKNSNYQRVAIETSIDFFAKAIPENIDIASLSGKKTFTIADFGCSTGPNTFTAIKNIIEVVNLKYKSISLQALEFHVFFNDHANNDFNTLFQNIPPSLPCFVAGVPGSFHGRLFPRASLDIVHSSYSLHWLSKVPTEINEKSSQAWNKDKIYCAGNNERATKAYFGQFQRDLNNFMKCRAEEVVGGGLMVILWYGNESGVDPPETSLGFVLELMGEALFDMAKMEVIEEEKVHSFNVPVYIPSMNEVKYVIETTNVFTIEKKVTWTHPYNSSLFSAKAFAALYRAGYEHCLQEHFGSEIIDQLFDILTKKLEENKHVFENDNHKRGHTFFLLLKRKDD